MIDPRVQPQRLGKWTRAALMLAALGLGVVLALARSVEPDPRGYGTHERLGLAPCSFLQLTGRRCPSCGMTTAFAWCARGRFDRALAANPAGALLAPTCLILIPWLLASAKLGRPWGTSTLEQPLTLLAVATVAVSLLAWTVPIVLSN